MREQLEQFWGQQGLAPTRRAEADGAVLVGDVGGRDALADEEAIYHFGDQDSNLNKQYQKLLCYRYTIPEGE